MTELVPSEALPSAQVVLTRLVQAAQSISAAVAFVTVGGVRSLQDTIASTKEAPTLEIVARAGGVTDPDALLLLRDELSAEVSVVIGRPAPQFHPKLWLIRQPGRLAILSGSGNLTDGGLHRNVEQFELLDVDATTDAAADHEARFDDLTKDALPLADVEGSAIWREWLTVCKRQRAALAEIRKLEHRLAQREVKPDRQKHKQQLLGDLIELYERTVSARLMQRNGRRYMPNRFKQGIDRASQGGDPVLLASRICRRQTEGFDVILDHDRPDLTVEALVVDVAKPYHDLFSDTTRRLSAERLRQFPSWTG